MKRTFSLIFLLTINLILLIVGHTKQVIPLFYIGAGFSIFFSLNIIIDIIKLTFKITFTSLLSITVNILSLGTTGYLAWQNLIPPEAIFCLTVTLSIFLVISVFRKLGEYSQNQKIINSILLSIINYKGSTKTDLFASTKDKQFEKILSKSLNSKGNNN